MFVSSVKPRVISAVTGRFAPSSVRPRRNVHKSTVHGSRVYVYNKKVGKPCNAADAGHVSFPKFGRRGAPMAVGISGVGQGISELVSCYRPSIQSHKISVAVLPQF